MLRKSYIEWSVADYLTYPALKISAYEEALKNAGYKEKLVYTEDKVKKSNRKRLRKMITFYPPYKYAANVQTNVVAKFLSIIDKNFKNTNLGKYFNKSNVKVSYSCMGNMESIIAVGVARCPFTGKCLTQSIIYTKQKYQQMKKLQSTLE